MAALTRDRPLIERHHGDRNFPVAANVLINDNAMVSVLVPSGLLAPAGGTATEKVVGCAKMRADNRGGAASAISCEVKSDTVRPMYNSGGVDAITLADIGAAAYAVDDQTVALTNGGGARPRAGRIHNVTELGVWILFDQ